MSVLEGHDFIILEDDPGRQAPFHNPAENTPIHVTLAVSYQPSAIRKRRRVYRAVPDRRLIADS
jgi:hypothetical protein